MARIFTDGAESGDTLRLQSGGGGAVTTQKRTGNYSYGISGSTSPLIVFSSSQTELYFRFAFLYDSDSNGTFGDSDGKMFFWSNGGSLTGSLRIDSGSFGNNTFKLAVYDGTTLRAVSEFLTWNINEWHVIEIHIKIAASPNGIYQVKFDGATVIDFSGTTNGSQASFDRVKWGGPVGGSNHQFVDDIAINDISGAVDNSWCGDGGVLAALVPNGAGNYTDLITSSGIAYQCVDEIPHNSDTDYVYESTVDKKSTYTMTDVSGLPTGASIARVWLELVAKETAADGGKIAPLLRSGSTDSQGSDQNLSLAYQRFLSAEYLTDPADGTAWTPTKVNALEAGAVVR